MPKYDIHIYAVVRLKIVSVEADSAWDATQKADQMVDFHQAVAAGKAEYADDIERFLVDRLDEAGQRIEGQSVFFDMKYEEPIPGQ